MSPRERVFHTPFGVGVCTEEAEALRTRLIDTFSIHKKEYGIESGRPFAPSNILRHWHQDNIGASVRAAEEIIGNILPLIKRLHFSFAALSSRQMATVPVGGYASPVRQIPTPKFLEMLNPMYSYLTAWTAGKAGIKLSEDVRIDAFESKQTAAWSQLINDTAPSVWLHGDEVDPLVCTADLIAFATDRLLYREKVKLNPGNIQTMWKTNGREVTSWLVGHGNVDWVTWKTDEGIDPMPHIRHPIVFLLRDLPEAYASPPKGKGFSSLMQSGPPFESALCLAVKKHGCLKFFNEFDDPKYIKDGDVFIYAGDKSKELAQVYKDMYDIEAMTFAEARVLIQKTNQKGTQEGERD
jgi:hypothetical protein